MKIAHISIIPTYSSGIFKKLSDKATIARNNNLNIDFYLLNCDKEYKKDNLFILKKTHNVPTVFLRKLLFRVYKLAFLLDSVDLDGYDAVVLRYPLVDGFGNRKFIKKYGSKIYSEHHTDEVSELFSLKLIDKFRWLLEVTMSSPFLSKVSGFITVTDELKQTQLNKIKVNKPCVTIANGINPDSFRKTGYKPFDGHTLKIIFISSYFYPWQGLEYLVDILDDYDGEVSIELNLVGSLSISQEKLIQISSNLNIKLHGQLSIDEVDMVMSEMNIAVSTLALSKKNMREACPLKSREYIVRGIPFVYAYIDTDLLGNEKFAKRLDEKSFSAEDLVDFARYVTKNENDVKCEFQKYVEIISWKKKLSAMVNFIEKNEEKS